VFLESNLFSATSYFFSFFFFLVCLEYKDMESKDIRKVSSGFDYFLLIFACEQALCAALNSAVNMYTFQRGYLPKSRNFARNSMILGGFTQ
jgi:hypothetical protein